MNLDRTAVCLVMSETGRLSRRCLLARLAALPAAFALRVLTASESGEAKNKHGHGHGHGHGKHHKHKKRRNKQKGHRARGGYAPDSEEQAFLALINQYRAQNGVGALALQPQLGAAANHHSEAMAQNNFFAHSALESVKNFGYTNWRYIGENIYAGTASASSAMNAWKNSADHNTNMLTAQYTELGIGRAYSQNSTYGWYWTTTFGSR